MDVSISHDPWAPDTDADGDPVIEDAEVFADVPEEKTKPVAKKPAAKKSGDSNVSK